MALESTQSFLCQFSLPPFSVFYLVDLVENKRQDVLPMGSGQEAWMERVVHTAVCLWRTGGISHGSQWPGLVSGFCKTGGGGSRDSSPLLLNLDPYLINIFECLRAFLALGHLTQCSKSISEYFCVSLSAHSCRLQTAEA